MQKAKVVLPAGTTGVFNGMHIEFTEPTVVVVDAEQYAMCYRQAVQMVRSYHTEPLPEVSGTQAG